MEMATGQMPEPELVWPLGARPNEQDWVPERLYGWQRWALDRLSVIGARVAMTAPHEAGATGVLIPAIGLAWMKAFPGSVVVSTAGNGRQIKAQLWPVLERLKGADWMQWKSRLEMRAPSEMGFPASSWHAFFTRNADDAEGWHSKWYRNDKSELRYAPLLVIIDAATGLNYELVSAMTMRCDPAAVLMIGTPGEKSGPLWDAMHSIHWDRLAVKWWDCPHLCTGDKLEARLKAIRGDGPGNPLVKNWIFGEFA
jgi:hypothetical protein